MDLQNHEIKNRKTEWVCVLKKIKKILSRFYNLLQKTTQIERSWPTSLITQVPQTATEFATRRARLRQTKQLKSARISQKHQTSQKISR